MVKVKLTAKMLDDLSSPLIFDEDGEHDSRVLAKLYVRDQRIDRIRELMSTRRELTMNEIQAIVDKEIPAR